MDIVLLLCFSLCCIQVLFIHLGGFVAPLVSTLHPSAFHPSRWCVLCFILMLFICPCGGFYVSSTQVVGLTFHPGAFHPSKWWVLRFIRPGGRFNVSSIQVMGSMFHPSRWWVLCFIHPCGGFYVSSIQVVGLGFWCFQSKPFDLHTIMSPIYNAA